MEAILLRHAPVALRERGEIALSGGHTLSSWRMAKQKRRHRVTATVARPSPRLLVELGEVETMRRRKQWAEMRQALAALDQRYPNNVDVLTGLVNLAYDLKDTQAYQRAAERLIALKPDDPDVTLGLAGAYMTNLHPALARRTFRRFLERWPDHARAAEVRTTLAGLEDALDTALGDLGLAANGAREEGLELAALHEAAQASLEDGRFVAARQLLDSLLRRRPDFVPGLNNLSQLQALDGQLDQASATAHRVLALQPDNVHALANLTQFECLGGRPDQAQHTAQRLKALDTHRSDAWVKIAQALSYLGDDQGVLNVFGRGEQAGHLGLPVRDPLLYHLAAVALLRLGREDEARRHWQRALELAPGLDVARDNLADLRRPIGDRHAPWPFPIANWLSGRLLRELVAPLAAAAQDTDQARVRAARRALRDHPEFTALVPLLLDRGDAQARELALRTATLAETPELLAALREFALGQRGPDAFRQQAGQAAIRAGLLSRGPVRFWSRGEWREMLLLGFEVHGEPVQRHHPPRVQERLAAAIAALRVGDARRAEQLLLQALEIEPDAPDLLNNLAATYEALGRGAAAAATIQRALERHPDYLFARTGMAQLHIQRDELAAAESLLDPLLTQERFHVSEFAAMCSARIDLYLAQRNHAAARSWLDMWVTVDPEHPQIGQWRRRLQSGGPWRRLLGGRRRQRE